MLKGGSKEKSKSAPRVWIETLYDERRYFDLWSVVHTASGGLTAAWLLWLGVPLGWTIVIGAVVLIGWEFFELAVGVEEYLLNRIGDVIYDAIGFTAVIAASLIWGAELAGWSLLFYTLGVSLLGFSGYLSYRARKN